ncbi:hypothetical protein V1281_002637 [Nitrobacteraceae bacterium AZCC 2161]
MNNIAKRTAAVGRAELPDGTFVNISEVASRGFVLEGWGEYDYRRASERNSRKVAIPTEEKTKTRASALIAYATAIEALPEAKARPAAASEIWASQTAQTMPVERAAAFLRGLPVETAPIAKAATTSTLTAQDNAMFKRKMELRINGLNMKADRGNPAARNEATKLGWAMRTRETTGCSFADAIQGAGLDARATITSILGN